ncbi:MAG: invasion protein [Pseudomonadales bacterium]|nr:invasion protein [Pseudomonadales bacterium]
MSLYLVIRYLHIACAIATLLSFSLRGFWMLQESPLLQARLAKVLPHIIDTVLLISAIALVIMSQQFPTVLNWISLKILFLLLYIGFGTFALKRGKTKQIRASCFIAALLCIGIIFSLALTKPVI